jgi:peptidoglycan/xylan/chitin deacetylase (PgdA/CDA1 family)
MKRPISSRLLGALSATDDRVVAALLRAGLGDRCVSLCFHRIVAGARRPGELNPKLTMPEEDIDRLIRFLLDSARRDDRWLTVCFDDGYREAAEYVLSRAPRHPEVEWLFFVCPEKTERQVGFRWDLAEASGGRLGDLESVVHAPADPSCENLRAELRGVAADARFALADVDACRRLQSLPNVQLGNHSNAHLRSVLLDPDRFRAEWEKSSADFRRLFGELRHVAFPFGVPGVDFDARHVDALRRMGRFEVWSTEPRPFRRDERGASAVLPRFAVDGTRSWKEGAAHLALHAMRTRVRSPRYSFPSSTSIEEIDRGGSSSGPVAAALRSAKPDASAA